VAEENV